MSWFQKDIAFNGFIQVLTRKRSKDSLNPDITVFLKKVLNVRTTRPELYEEALTHKSFNQKSPNNEKLEFLGDSIISAIISHYLLDFFPEKSEGELSIIRSNIVRRDTLNKIAKEFGIDKLLRIHPRLKLDKAEKSKLVGNALEALVAALYLDKGFKKTHRIVISKLIWPYILKHELAEEEKNFKGRLIELSQQKNFELSFITDENDIKGVRHYYTKVLINGIEYGNARSLKKKESEQIAAEIAYKKLFFSQGA